MQVAVPETSFSASAEPPRGARPLRILHVDDDDNDATLFTAAARHAFPGSDLRRACDVAEGLEELARGDVDVVVCDLQMPGTEGPSAVSTIRTFHPGLPLIVLTTRDGRGLAEALLVAGADAYITKRDLRPDLLSRVFGYVLAQHGGQVPDRGMKP